MLDVKRAALARAKARLDRLDLYPRPVSLRSVRVLIVPRFFKLPLLRRFDGYALHGTILLRSPAFLEDDDLKILGGRTALRPCNRLLQAGDLPALD